jgi:hypothetical protein
MPSLPGDLNAEEIVGRERRVVVGQVIHQHDRRSRTGALVRIDKSALAGAQAGQKIDVGVERVYAEKE